MESLSNQKMQTQRFKCVVKRFQINLFLMKDKLLNVFSSSTKFNTFNHMWWENKGWNPNGECVMLSFVGSWKWQNCGSWWWLMVNSEFSIFVVSCFFASYELAKVFMNDDIYLGMVFLMGELYVVWHYWVDLFCRTSIKFKWNWKLKCRNFFATSS